MKTSQCTINIITCILCTQMNRMIQVSFSIRILSLLQTDNSACSPPVRIIAIHFNRLFKIIQGLYRIFLLQWYFTTHQISTSVSGRYFQQFSQILFSCSIVLLLHVAKRKIMPQDKIFRIIFQGCLIILYGSVIIILPNTSQPTYLISAYHKRIALDSSITVRFRTLKIIQINLCQTTKEVRLI